MSEIIVYTTKTCPKCVRLKKLLMEKNVSYGEADLTTPEALTELRINGVFTNEAPVLQIDDDFLTCGELFNGNEVNLEAIHTIL